jgi:hypothetical protein
MQAYTDIQCFWHIYHQAQGCGRGGVYRNLCEYTHCVDIFQVLITMPASVGINVTQQIQGGAKARETCCMDSGSQLGQCSADPCNIRNRIITFYQAEMKWIEINSRQNEEKQMDPNGLMLLVMA